jgi:MFS family permease
VFALNYMTQQLHLPKTMVLQGNMLAYGVQLLTIPFFSWLSDRVGRRPVYMGGALFSVAFAVPFFLMVNTQS